MIRHVWSVLCQSASIDVQSNRVSLFNSLEDLPLTEIPSSDHPIAISCELMSLWTHEPEDKLDKGAARVTLISPSGKKSSPVIIDIDLTQSSFHHTRVIIGSLPIISIGRYEILVEFHVSDETVWQLAAQIPLLVFVQSNAPAAGD